MSDHQPFLSDVSNIRKSNDRLISERASSLVNTSVEDMNSSLVHYTYLNIKDVQTVRLCLSICQKRGEKTKATMLRRKLAKMEKQLVQAKQLFKGSPSPKPEVES